MYTYRERGILEIEMPKKILWKKQDTSILLCGFVFTHQFASQTILVLIFWLSVSISVMSSVHHSTFTPLTYFLPSHLDWWKNYHWDTKLTMTESSAWADNMLLLSCVIRFDWFVIPAQQQKSVHEVNYHVVCGNLSAG